MKKIFTLLLMSLIGLSGITNAAETKKETAHWEVLSAGPNSNMYVFTDVQAGCQYLIYIHSIGTVKMLPRIGKDGKHICFDASKPEAESFK